MPLFTIFLFSSNCSTWYCNQHQVGLRFLLFSSTLPYSWLTTFSDSDLLIEAFPLLLSSSWSSTWFHLIPVSSWFDISAWLPRPSIFKSQLIDICFTKSTRFSTLYNFWNCLAKGALRIQDLYLNWHVSWFNNHTILLYKVAGSQATKASSKMQSKSTKNNDKLQCHTLKN